MALKMSHTLGLRKSIPYISPRWPQNARPVSESVSRKRSAKQTSLTVALAGERPLGHVVPVVPRADFSADGVVDAESVTAVGEWAGSLENQRSCCLDAGSAFMKNES